MLLFKVFFIITSIHLIRIPNGRPLEFYSVYRFLSEEIMNHINGSRSVVSCSDYATLCGVLLLRDNIKNKYTVFILFTQNIFPFKNQKEKR